MIALCAAGTFKALYRVADEPFPLRDPEVCSATLRSRDVQKRFLFSFSEQNIKPVRAPGERASFHMYGKSFRFRFLVSLFITLCWFQLQG